MLYCILRPFMWLFYKIFYPVTIFGKENLIKKGKCIVACNHLGKADVLVVGALYPDKTIFLSKKEWYNNKAFGWLLRKLGSIPIDRDKPSLTTIKEALKVLKENKRLGIFPEGRRNFDNARPSKTYREGLAQGYLNARREVAHWFNLHLAVSMKKPTKNAEKAYKKFLEFIDLEAEE